MVLSNIWQELYIQYVNNLIGSMTRRFVTLIEAHEGATILNMVKFVESDNLFEPEFTLSLKHNFIYFSQI